MNTLADIEETGPIRAAILKAADVIDRRFYGAYPDGFEAPFLQAKYRAKGVEPNSDAWNPKPFEATEEALAPYAEALIRVLDEDSLQQGMPKDLIDAREAMRNSVQDLRAETQTFGM